MRTAPTSVLDRRVVLETLARVFDREGMMPRLSAVTQRLKAPAQVWLFGGAIRNAILSEKLDHYVPIRDLDFVVFNIEDDALAKAFAPEAPRLNTFGGLKVTLEGLTVDIWRAELQWLIAGHAQPMARTIEAYLNCVTLTTDAVLYDVQRKELQEQGFLRAMSERTIDIGADSHWVEPWVPYHLAHLAYVRSLTNFEVGERARSTVREVATGGVIERAVQYLATGNKCDDPRRVVVTLVQHVRE